MIVLDLECEQGHRFEGWFASSMAFDHQLAHDLISCPSCGALGVVRRPSAPYVQVRSVPAPAAERSGALVKPSGMDALTEHLLAHLRNVARNLEDVGERFVEEARRIHHGESESRGIKGKASTSDLRDLLEEGIGVLPVPPDEKLH